LTHELVNQQRVIALPVIAALARNIIVTELQPDQKPEEWDKYVAAYEAVFEPFTMKFASEAIDHLNLAPGHSVLDVGAGSGGAALELAARGMRVTAIDASFRMVERIRARANARGVAVEAQAMDGQALVFADATFDAALSVLGVILFPDAARGLAEMHRVVRKGGKVAIVTWTMPERYELAVEMRAAMRSVLPELPAMPLPAQLRYRDAGDFRALFDGIGLKDISIELVTGALEAPSARWLAERIAFAPGMAATVAGLGHSRKAVLETFAQNLEARRGTGKIRLEGVAFVGSTVV
jgi:ubiquinone/menaquinone biosynthesis C-methylase UbiE